MYVCAPEELYFAIQASTNPEAELPAKAVLLIVPPQITLSLESTAKALRLSAELCPS
jgi:hypothetical protein